MRYLLRFLAMLVVGSCLLAASAVAVAPRALEIFTANHGVAEPINLDLLETRSLVFDRTGGVRAVLHAEVNRAPILLADVPAPVVETVLAVEDENFYNHKGVDLRGTLRALFENVAAGGIEQGGSTITMQVVKNAVLSPERDLSRKIREAVLAARLEEQMTKDEILERYLNTVYFGNGSYGVQAGAETYFGVSANQLGWAEAALLTSLIRCPTECDPFKNPQVALERRRLTLQRLVETGDLTAEEAEVYAFTPLPTAPHIVLPPPDDYFVEEVKQQLLDDTRLGATRSEREKAVFYGGLRIFTTIDPVMQSHAEAARTEILPGDGTGVFEIPTRNTQELTDCHAPEGATACLGTAAIASVEPTTGAIRAMVGGPGFETFKFNLATAPLRQTGSAFKTFVLVAALENGLVPSDTISGSSPCKFENKGGYPDPYIGHNSEGSAGVATIASQTAGSVNCAFLRLGQVVGLEKVVEQAQKMGVSSPLSAVLSLPLGSIGVSPLEMAAAYAAIANDGIYNKPYYIDRVEDRDGNVLFEQRADPHRAMSVQTARLATQVLQQVVTSGTGHRARLPERQVAGKTGTAQENRDAWFVGYTPQLSTAVWMGSPEAQVAMRSVGGIRVFGGTYPARIWNRFMSAALQDLPAEIFPKPDGTRRGRGLTRVEGEISPPSTAPPAEGGAVPTFTIPFPTTPDCNGRKCDDTSTTIGPPGND